MARRRSRHFSGGPGSGTSKSKAASSHRNKFKEAAKACSRKIKSGQFKGKIWHCIGKALKHKKS
jgi:hypothetical protein